MSMQTASKRRRSWRRGTLAVALCLVAPGGLGTLAFAAGTPAILTMQRPDGAEMPAARFPHWKHQRRYKCYTCHPRIFSKVERARFTHDEMGERLYCGACHDGKLAFLPQDKDCEVCHVE